MIELTFEQKEALLKIKNWYLDFYNKKERNVLSQPYFFLTGCAGSGKTTIISQLKFELEIDDYNIVYVTYTGKASLVLKRKGINATTIHKLIYQPLYDSNGHISGFKKLEKLDDMVNLIIVDECSMVSEEIMNDLLSFQIPILMVGDLNQLPPINGFNKFLKNPDFRLTKILRQSEENPIIRLSQDILNGNAWWNINYGHNITIKKYDEISYNLYEFMDIIITSTNKTRKKINQYYRNKILGLKGELPVIGDKIICLNNNYSIWNFDGISLTNGLLGYITDIGAKNYSKEEINQQEDNEIAGRMEIENKLYRSCGVLFVDFLPEWDFSKQELENKNNLEKFTNSIMWKIGNNNEKLKQFKIKYIDKSIFNNEDYSEPRQIFEDMYPNFFRYESQINSIDFGYCITCHKSQGSEFDNGLILMDWVNPSMKKSWLYTSVTRFKNIVILGY